MQLTRVLACAALLAATAGAFAGAATVQTPSKRQELKLLYVMEYDCMFDWEPVSLEPKLTDGVLAWMLNLHDRLTVTSETPLGEELMVSLILSVTLHLSCYQMHVSDYPFFCPSS